MIDIYFYCPTHRREIDAGLQVDKDTFERTRLNIIHVQCLHCSHEHRFLMADSHNDSAPRVQFARPQVPIRPSLGVGRAPIADVWFQAARLQRHSAQALATTSMASTSMHGFRP